MRNKPESGREETAMRQIGIGIIGCGNISEAYLNSAPKFPLLKVVAVADINEEAARAKAEAHHVEALSVDALLADPRIEIVLNLTTPQHHVPVALKTLQAGKHAYSEKPLAVRLADGLKLREAARKSGLRVGCAPDTFLGGAHQTARKAIDSGAIGTVNAGSAAMQVPGHELWHPNPDFYYQEGGGPLLDMGPYYLTCLVNLLGSVQSVTGVAKSAYDTRTIASGARAGQTIRVEVPTHISAILSFENGAAITLTTSFDVWKHGHNHIELYGSKGSMIVSDPNQFGGVIQVSDKRGDWQSVDQSHIYGDGNYRIIGLADMAQAIVSNRPHRASLDLSLHVLDIMESILVSADQGRRIDLDTRSTRPDMMDDMLPFGTL
jgi:predicted dehydrogenase